MKGEEVTIAEMVRNGTMSAEMAGLLWAAVDAQVSFMTVAVPQNAGKSTTAEAVLALRPEGMPLFPVANDPEFLAQLREERRGGYLCVAEFNPYMRRNYIWDEPARRVFDALPAGYALQASLHAPSAVDGMREITHGIGVSDERAAAMKLVLYLEMLGDWREPGVRRRLVDLYEVERVRDGEPIGKSLFRWVPGSDSFQQQAEPKTFDCDPANLERRAAIIGDLARAGRTSSHDVAEAVAGYRTSTGYRTSSRWLPDPQVGG